MQNVRMANKNLREHLRARVKKGKESTDVFGFKLCRYCKRYVPKGRRTFCSNECVHEHKLRSNIDYMRKEVFKRDKGICSLCHLDCIEALEKLSPLTQQEKYIQLLEKGFPKNRIQMAIKKNMALWDADHIVPVIDGGGGCGLEGMRTVCAACHLKETKKQMFIRNYGNHETLWGTNIIDEFI